MGIENVDGEDPEGGAPEDRGQALNTMPFKLETTAVGWILDRI